LRVRAAARGWHWDPLRVDGEAVIVGCQVVDPVSGAGDQGQVGEAVGRWLRTLPRDGPRPIDLRENGGFQSLTDGVGRRPGDDIFNVEVGTRVVDHDHITCSEPIEVRENRRSPEHVINMPGDRDRARAPGNSRASIPERLVPNRIVGRTLGRVHHIRRGDPHGQDRSTDPERWNPQLEWHVDWTSPEVETRVDQGRWLLTRLSRRGAGRGC